MRVPKISAIKQQRRHRKRHLAPSGRSVAWPAGEAAVSIICYVLSCRKQRRIGIAHALARAAGVLAGMVLHSDVNSALHRKWKHV